MFLCIIKNQNDDLQTAYYSKKKKIYSADDAFGFTNQLVKLSKNPSLLYSIVQGLVQSITDNLKSLTPITVNSYFPKLKFLFTITAIAQHLE